MFNYKIPVLHSPETGTSSASQTRQLPPHSWRTFNRMDPSDRNARGGLARGTIRFMNSGGLEKRLSSPLTQYRLRLSTERVCIAEHGPPIFLSTYPHLYKYFHRRDLSHQPVNFQEPVYTRLNEMIITLYILMHILTGNCKLKLNKNLKKKVNFINEASKIKKKSQ